MPKITVSRSVKVPGTQEYSSEQFHVGLEIEADVTTPEQFQTVTAALFTDIEQALQTQMNQHRTPQLQPNPAWPRPRNDMPQRSNGNGHGYRNGNGYNPQSPPNGGTASSKQLRYLTTLAGRHGINPSQLGEWLAAEHGIAGGVQSLTPAQASQVIDRLKGAGNGHRR
jgi:hypothetical protein